MITTVIVTTVVIIVAIIMIMAIICFKYFYKERITTDVATVETEVKKASDAVVSDVKTDVKDVEAK